MSAEWGERVLAQAKANLRREWGTAWPALGDRFQRALLAEAVLDIISLLDVSDRSVAKKAETLDNILSLVLSVDSQVL